MNNDDTLKIAEHTRRLCLAVARDAYEDASIAGLCGEGALEAALGAIESLDLRSITDSNSNERD